MNSVVVRPSGDRRFYLAVAVGIVVVTLAGFSIDADLAFHLDTLSALVILHGALMFGWIVMFAIQTALVAVGRTDLHRRLGVVGVALGVALILTGVRTIFVAVRLGGDHMPPGASTTEFLAQGLALFMLFGVLATAGIALRRRPDFHKRLMTLATIPLLDAAIQRFVSVYTNWQLETSDLRNGLILLCVIVDTVRYRRLHPVFLLGGALILLSDALATVMAPTPLWAHFTAWVVSP